MRSVRLALLAGLFVILLTAGVVRARRPAEPPGEPAQQVRDAVVRFTRAVEQGDLPVALDLISDEFRGQRQTKTDIAEILGAMRRDFRWMEIYVDRVDVKLASDGRRASVKVYGAFAGQAGTGNFEYGQDELVEVESIFVLERGRWRAITIRNLPFIYGLRY